MPIDTILHLRRILDCVPAAIFAVDLKWNVIFFNREAEKLMGFTRAEALNQKCYKIFRSQSCPDNCCIKKAMQSGIETVKAKAVVFSKDNQKIHVKYRASRLRDEKGEDIGWVETLFDDSARVALEKKLRESYTFDDIVGKDEKIGKLFEKLRILSMADSSILITGETGTGKDIFARSVHNTSLRKNGPFVKINCAALPDQLLESELFGYMKGAFTDARGDKLGRFQLAEGGSIFLDEIGDLSLGLQSKLLQVLDEKEFFPLGSTASTRVDVRLISATNQNLEKMVEDRAFREDLYYRLKVVEIRLPPLRDRSADIPLLLDHFIRDLANSLEKEIPRVSHKVIRMLLNYSFPGNVRELKNIVEHAMLLCSNSQILIDDLPTYLTETGEVSSQSMLAKSYKVSENHLLDKGKEGLLEALEEHRWHMQDTANALQINRTTLWRKLKRYNILPSESAASSQ
jgi:PAS domain S-box-containing protein